jgi:hypothetical protein
VDKKVNKHITDQEELLKRLETGETGGLDDFEKEALEGFASLENTGLSKSLTDSLNKRISEKYFKAEKEETKRNKFWYLSMAAGLFFVIGLSIFFVSYFAKEEQNLAIVSEKEISNPELSEPKPAADMKAPEAPEEESSKNTNSEQPLTSSAKTEGKKEEAYKKQSEQAEELKSRAVVKKAEQRNDNEAMSGKDDDKSGYGNGNTAPVLAGTKVAQGTTASGEKVSDQLALDETQKSSGGVSKDAYLENDSKKGKSKEPDAAKPTTKDSRNKRDEAPSSQSGPPATEDNTPAKEYVVTNSMAATGTSNNVSATPVFWSPNPDSREYIKKKIETNEGLKGIKEFKAKIHLSENGNVVKVEIKEVKGCKTCEKELEHVLMDMPDWKPAIKGEKKVKDVIEFVYP